MVVCLGLECSVDACLPAVPRWWCSADLGVGNALPEDGPRGLGPLLALPPMCSVICGKSLPLRHQWSQQDYPKSSFSGSKSGVDDHRKNFHCHLFIGYL